MQNKTFSVAPDQNTSHNTIMNTNKSRPVPMIIKLFQLGFRLGGRIVPKLTGRIAYKLWITPPRYKTPKSERNALQSATIEFHEINNQSIATYQWGQSGPMVLLVHGWSGRGTQLGAFAEKLTDAGFRVLSFDAPAHGKSSGKQTHIYEIADTILALDKIYGAFKSVITHSFGGPCLALAMRNGLTTSRVVNISPPAETAGLVKKFVTTLAIPPPVETELIRCIEHDFGKKVWQDTSMENNIAELDVPAMVIHDVDDVDVPWHEGQKIAQLWSEVRFIKTSKLGHRRILRDPATIDTTVEFIKGYSTS